MLFWIIALAVFLATFFRHRRFELAMPKGKTTIMRAWIFCPPWWDERKAMFQGRAFFVRTEDK